MRGTGRGGHGRLTTREWQRRTRRRGSGRGRRRGSGPGRRSGRGRPRWRRPWPGRRRGGAGRSGGRGRRPLGAGRWAGLVSGGSIAVHTWGGAERGPQPPAPGTGEWERVASSTGPRSWARRHRAGTPVAGPVSTLTGTEAVEHIIV